MLKFISKFCALALLFTTIVVALHAITIWRMQSEIDKAYTLRPDQEILFLGSSQVGCSILERPEYRNKVLWISDTAIQASLVKLRELDRRGQLKNVKVLAIPLNEVIVEQQTDRTLKWGWYQELPVSWRYPDLLPCGKLEMFGYIMSNLRCPLILHVSDTPPLGRPSIASRPEAWQKSFFLTLPLNRGSKLDDDLIDDWLGVLKSVVAEMIGIAKRNGIKVVVYRMPTLPVYEQSISQELASANNVLIDYCQSLGAEYIDMPTICGEDYYFDMVHFIEPGAEKFTADLYNKSPTLRCDE